MRTEFQLAECPEARVQGSTDTSPSSLPRGGSIKSVSILELFTLIGAAALAHLFACELNALSWFAEAGAPGSHLTPARVKAESLINVKHTVRMSVLLHSRFRL